MGYPAAAPCMAWHLAWQAWPALTPCKSNTSALPQAFESEAYLFDAPEVAGGSFLFQPVPTGVFYGRVRTINALGNATSPASPDAVVTGKPGAPSKPVVQNGQTGFPVSFNPGARLAAGGGGAGRVGRMAPTRSTACPLLSRPPLFFTPPPPDPCPPPCVPLCAGSPVLATAWFFNIYAEGSDTPLNADPIPADPSSGATGATAPSTPSGGYNYAGVTPSDTLSFLTGNLAGLQPLALQAGVYQVGAACRWLGTAACKRRSHHPLHSQP